VAGADARTGATAGSTGVGAGTGAAAAAWDGAELAVAVGVGSAGDDAPLFPFAWNGTGCSAL
jgi:hypothetical protein